MNFLEEFVFTLFTSSYKMDLKSIQKEFSRNQSPFVIPGSKYLPCPVTGLPPLDEPNLIKYASNRLLIKDNFLQEFFPFPFGKGGVK